MNKIKRWAGCVLLILGMLPPFAMVFLWCGWRGLVALVAGILETAILAWIGLSLVLGGQDGG